MVLGTGRSEGRKGILFRDLAAFLFSLLSLACAPGRPPAPAAAPVPAPAVAAPSIAIAASVPAKAAEGAVTPKEARSVALHFELNGREFPLPLVRGTVGGEPVWMLIDTGANSHVVASWVARKVKMPLRSLGEVGSDHAGRAVNAYAASHPNVVIDGWGSLGDAPILVTDVPEPIASIGIGAFISPQALAREGEGVVLDLSAREMHLSRWEEGARQVEARGGVPLAPEGARLCRDETGLVRGLAFVVQATVEGHRVSLLLDTGAHHTDLLTTSRAATSLAPRSTPSKEQMYAASGLVHTRLVHGAHVKVGAWSLTTDVDLVPGTADKPCPRDGAVSMDALGACTLLLGKKGMVGRCGR
jgi:predicted aspartyl protease